MPLYYAPAGLPRGTIASASATASQGSILTTAVDVTGVTVSPTLFPGRRYLVSATGMGCQSTVANDVYQYQLVQGTTPTIFAQTRGSCGPTVSTSFQGFDLFGILTGFNGVLTIKLQVMRVNGSGTLTSYASAVVPTAILVEDIGV